MELALRIGCNNRMLFESDAPRYRARVRICVKQFTETTMFCVIMQVRYVWRKTLMAIHGVFVRLTEKDGYEEGV